MGHYRPALSSSAKALRREVCELQLRERPAGQPTSCARLRVRTAHNAGARAGPARRRDRQPSAMRRLLPLLAVVRADDDYRADGPMTIPYDPVTGEPISTVRPGWSCSNPCPTEFTNYYGPCCLNSAGEARWNLDNYCEDSLKFHTYYDSDMKFNYECEAAVDRYGCGPPVDELSGWMCVVRVRSFPCAPSTRQLLDGVRGQLVEPSAMA